MDLTFFDTVLRIGKNTSKDLKSKYIIKIDKI